MEVTKEVARPGTYTYLDERGMPARLTVTPERIKSWHDKGNAMIAENLSVPVPQEHQTNLGVMTPAERAAHQLRNNAGFVKKYEVKTIGGEDRLFSVLDIPDPSLAKKLPTTIRSVSPWINSFVDGNGKRWDDVISHVALTLRPRMHNQAPFATTGAAMSIVSGLKDTGIPKTGIPLYSAGLLVPKDGQLKPKYPRKFSLMTGIKLSEEELEKADEEEKADDEGTKPEPSKDGEGEGDPAAAAMADDMDDGDEDAADVSFEELIRHLLEMHDIHIPAGGRGKEFLQSLTQGLLASAKEKMATQDKPDGSGVLDPAAAAKPGAAAPGPIKQEQPPMYMSLTPADVQRITDPKEKATAEAFLSLRQQYDSVATNILADAGVRRQARLDRLLKKLPADARASLVAKASAPSAQLSLSNGVVVDPIGWELDLLEKCIPDLPAMILEDAKFAVQPHPTVGTELTPAQAEELVNMQCRNIGPVKAA